MNDGTFGCRFSLVLPIKTSNVVHIREPLSRERERGEGVRDLTFFHFTEERVELAYSVWVTEPPHKLPCLRARGPSSRERERGVIPLFFTYNQGINQVGGQRP